MNRGGIANRPIHLRRSPKRLFGRMSERLFSYEKVMKRLENKVDDRAVVP